MSKYIVLFLLLQVVSFHVIQAQSEYNWEPIGLTLTGNNLQQGVEAFYKIAECNEENFIVVKFINHNDNDVILEWEDGVFTQDLEWVSNSSGYSYKTINILAKEEVSGDCYNLDSGLMIRIEDFIENFSDFNKYRTLSLVIR